MVKNGFGWLDAYQMPVSFRMFYIKLINKLMEEEKKELSKMDSSYNEKQTPKSNLVPDFVAARVPKNNA